MGEMVGRLAVSEFKRGNGGRIQRGVKQSIFNHLQHAYIPSSSLHEYSHPQLAENNDLTPLHEWIQTPKGRIQIVWEEG